MGAGRTLVGLVVKFGVTSRGGAVGFRLATGDDG